MSGKYLLDTNIIIALLASESGVARNIQQADEVYVAGIAAGELLYGARKSRRSQENMEKVEDLLTNVPILGCDLETARQYGEIKYQLQIKGKPIPENDLWIAAICVRSGLVLVTRDAHFDEVDGLQVEKW